MIFESDTSSSSSLFLDRALMSVLKEKYKKAAAAANFTAQSHLMRIWFKKLPAKTASAFRTMIAARVPAVMSRILYFEVSPMSMSWVLSPISAKNSVARTEKNKIASSIQSILLILKEAFNCIIPFFSRPFIKDWKFDKIPLEM